VHVLELGFPGAKAAVGAVSRRWPLLLRRMSTCKSAGDGQCRKMNKSGLTKNSPISNTTFFALLAFIFLVTFVFSFILAPFHVEGDQVHYVHAYEAMAGLGIIDAFNKYQSIIFTAEPFHFFIIWLFSNLGVEKNLLMAFANALLAVLFAKYLRLKGSGFLLLIWIVFSTYYLHAMFFTLERTKFAFIFLLFFLLTFHRWWIFLAVLTHSMLLIPVALVAIGKKLFTVHQHAHNKLTKKYTYYLYNLLYAVVIIFIFFQILGIHLQYKFFAYFSKDASLGVFDLLPIVIFGAATFMTCKDKKNVLFFYSSLLVLSILLGGTRIDLIGFFGYLYFSNFSHQVFKFSIFVFGVYFLYLSWMYILNIYHYGG
jgi:hypothetical protein